jgi:hypothetical protein
MMYKIKKLLHIKSKKKDLEEPNMKYKITTDRSDSNHKQISNNQITYKVVEKNPVPNFDEAIKVEEFALGIQPYHVKEHSIVKPTDKEPSIFKLIHDKLSKPHNEPKPKK